MYHTLEIRLVLTPASRLVLCSALCAQTVLHRPAFRLFQYCLGGKDSTMASAVRLSLRTRCRRRRRRRRGRREAAMKAFVAELTNDESPSALNPKIHTNIHTYIHTLAPATRWRR